MAFVEIDDLLELDKEIVEKEKEKKKQLVLKAFKKLDYHEREVRKLENSKISAKYTLINENIDLKKLEEDAQKIHQINVGKRETLKLAEDMKDKYVEQEKILMKQKFQEELKDFKKTLSDSFKEKILNATLEKCKAQKEEREKLALERENIRQAREKKEKDSIRDRNMGLELQRGTEFNRDKAAGAEG